MFISDTTLPPLQLRRMFATSFHIHADPPLTFQANQVTRLMYCETPITEIALITHNI